MSNSNTSRTAFVLMKISGDSWNDSAYQAMCEVIEEGGYHPLRADQIRTSGPVVEEVCRLIREVPLLLIDTSGDSHSVAYELGYAHGVGRSHDKTIVLRSVASGLIPFNYAHFRLIMYRDQRHLKRLLRERLSLSTPLRDDQLGFALNFSIMPNAGEYGGAVANAILEVLKELRYTGRCEYYAGNPFTAGESFYIVGLALRSDKRLVPKGGWWKCLTKMVAERIRRAETKVILNADLCEIGEVRDLRRDYLPRGVAELSDGGLVSILGDSQADDSLFLAECRALMVPATKRDAEQSASLVRSTRPRVKRR